jgi:hypothetical protein
MPAGRAGYARVMRLRIATCLSGALLLAMGCGSGQDSAVEGSAERFEAAVAAEDAGTACQLLAPATRSEIESANHRPCVEAWASEGVPFGGHVTRVRAYGSMAIVELDADTVFLARFDSGWRVMAAHCAPRADAPYECQVKGS